MSAVLKLEHAFRPMQMQDLDAVMAIEDVIYTHPWSRGNFSDSLNAGYSCWVLEEGETMLGYAVMMLVMDESHLLNLSIAREFQGCGYGRALLEKMKELARRHGAVNMFLEVRVSNRTAISLYEKAGFNEMAIRRKYYPSHVGREDAVLMGAAL
ncbi:MAG TPA: ribosomal protein S18-alanine N-acetyltransferase [Methylophilaceae bacterium]|nr:ribosomal protein S18-alanine N-acetyltransferase [Methylophilaceae bacterium]